MDLLFLFINFTCNVILARYILWLSVSLSCLVGVIFIKTVAWTYHKTNAAQQPRYSKSAIADRPARRSVSVEMLSTVIRITQTDRLSAWEPLSATTTFYSATCIVLLLYTNRCTRHNYRTASMQCRACHQETFIYNRFCWCQLGRNCDQPTSTTTSVVDDTAYYSANASSCTRTTAEDGHKCFKQQKWSSLCLYFVQLPICYHLFPNMLQYILLLCVFKFKAQNIKTCILSKLLHRLKPNFAHWQRRLPFWKNRKRPYLRHALTDLHKIWRDGAFWPSEGYERWKFQTFKNRRCWTAAIVKNWKTAISLQRFDRITPKICQGQPPILGSQTFKFHPNGFTFSGVIAERAKAVFLPIE